MRRCRPLLGTFVEVDCGDASAGAAAFASIEQIHGLMSAHDPDSDLSEINRTAHRVAVPVSDLTEEVLRRAMRWASLSGGAFDIVRAGGKAVARGALPLHPGQPRPDPAADWRAIRLEDGAVTLDRPACLDLGGIAKGYAVDLAIGTMQRTGATRGLVNAGGDLRGSGDEPWAVAVSDPLTRRPLVTLMLRNQALATSAGLPKSVAELDFAHLPESSKRWLSVTVRAPRACDADALTKIVWAIGDAAEGLLIDHGANAFAIDVDRQVRPIGRAMAAAA